MKLYQHEINDEDEPNWIPSFEKFKDDDYFLARMDGFHDKCKAKFVPHIVKYIDGKVISIAYDQDITELGHEFGEEILYAPIPKEGWKLGELCEWNKYYISFSKDGFKIELGNTKKPIKLFVEPPPCDDGGEYVTHYV